MPLTLYSSINYRLYVYCLLKLAIFIGQIKSWEPDAIPKIYIKYDQELPMFYGNLTDYFKILDQDDSSVLIGASNNVYNISLSNLLENRKRRIEWISSDAHRELCALKGKQETDCQNYIRVFARISDTQIMICGTNSYKPLCRFYVQTQVPGTVQLADGQTDNTAGQLELSNEIEAQGRCPYNPTHNSTYVFTDGQLYSATVADFSGGDPLIYRETQRTEQYDLKQLNQPAFVNALERNGYVFIFFREIAMEHMNCGKTIFSRVGRVCKNDKGGPNKFINRWTSFLKTRLNCSIPGEYPFYFDEIQATSRIIEGIYDNDQQHSVIYAIFTTSSNAIPGSAVCAFSVDDIMASFEGRFKYQKDSTSNWLPVPVDQVPEPRPGKCVDDSRTLPTFSVNFVKTHTLMESPVPALFGRPILTRVNLKHRFTAITVDPQIRAMDGNRYDVIFVGTDDGRVVKFIRSNDSDGDYEPIVITETQALPHGISVKELTVSRKTQTLIVIGNNHIVSIPLHHCTKFVLCRDCFNLHDPYCVWDNNNQECTSQADVHFKTLTTLKSSVCKKYGSVAGKDRIETPPIVIQSTKGTVASVGRMPVHHGHRPGYESDDNEITMTSIDGSELINQINSHKTHHIDPLVKEHLGSASGDSGNGSEGGMFQMANSSIIVLMCVLFVAGLTCGFFLSKLKMRFVPCYNEHRNQLSAFGQKRHLQPLNGSSGINTGAKDINLLMDNTFSGGLCNNKKDNLDQEFAKDRSHECKNSTENLEKDALNLKGGLNSTVGLISVASMGTTGSIGPNSGGNIGTGGMGSSGTSLKVIKTYL